MHPNEKLQSGCMNKSKVSSPTKDPQISEEANEKLQSGCLNKSRDLSSTKYADDEFSLAAKARRTDTGVVLKDKRPSGAVLKDPGADDEFSLSVPASAKDQDLEEGGTQSPCAITVSPPIGWWINAKMLRGGGQEADDFPPLSISIDADGADDKFSSEEKTI